MLEVINHWDTALLLFLNGINDPFWDKVMMLVTNKYVWIPLYLFILVQAVRMQRWRGLAVFGVLVLVVALSDQFASGFMKPTVKRLRPCYEETLQEQLHQPMGCSGRYAFFSSHASNSMSVAVFLTLVYRRRTRWIYALIPIAVLVSYSRIYLGKHYPLDVLAGWLFGTVLAFAAWRVSARWIRPPPGAMAPAAASDPEPPEDL